MEPIQLLTSITLVLVLGLLISIISSKLKIPNLLLLILAGSALGYQVSGYQFTLPPAFQNTLALIALAFIVFEGTVKIKFRVLNTFSLKSLKLVLISTISTLTLFSLAIHYVAGLSWLASVLIATFVSGTSPAVILSLLKNSKHSVVEILKFESLFNTPLTLILPVLVLGVGVSGGAIAAEVGMQLVDFIKSIVTGIGSGVLMGMLLIKFIRMTNLQQLYTSLGIMLSSLLAFVLAENLGGNGVVSVTTLGLFFGNVYLGKMVTKTGVQLTKFGSTLTHAIYLIVFILLGTSLKFPRNWEEFFISFALFLLYLIIRFIAIYVSLYKTLNFKEMIFATGTAAKGIATATVIFAVVLTGLGPSSSLDAKDLFGILNLSMLLIFYSIVLSTIMARSSQYFIQEVIKDKPK